MNRILLVVMFWMITSCATTIAPIANDVDVKLDEDAGYILLGLGSNRNLNAIQLSGPQNIRLTSKDLRPGTQYLLVNLKSGIYTIERVQLDSIYHISLGDDVWSVEVRPKTISYVGNLEVNSRGRWSNVEIVNRSSEALEFMEEDFPAILSSRDLVFSGAGVDYFFDLVGAKKAEVVK